MVYFYGETTTYLLLQVSQVHNKIYICSLVWFFMFWINKNLYGFIMFAEENVNFNQENIYLW